MIIVTMYHLRKSRVLFRYYVIGKVTSHREGVPDQSRRDDGLNEFENTIADRLMGMTTKSFRSGSGSAVAAALKMLSKPSAINPNVEVPSTMVSSIVSEMFDCIATRSATPLKSTTEIVGRLSVSDGIVAEPTLCAGDDIVPGVGVPGALISPLGYTNR